MGEPSRTAVRESQFPQTSKWPSTCSPTPTGTCQPYPGSWPLDSQGGTSPN